ncbi:uncharacterized protein EAE97_005426 [Botrytis byssoidea]|uniref:2EXR domain-containing protein n=1 Tax=Botrytis byssoidea TaxID=139641 RepID=A0A9P5M5T9_9HELO|nr:uncharacterized protein EAE97_005426 [Botrytis byssoidea]KAF7944793.1 hypothetical protein EAE97_005426 [Botrytis byssoidea]
MTDHTPGIVSSHNEPREMKLEYKIEKCLGSSSHPKKEVEEVNDISNEPLKSNILDLIRSSKSDASHEDSQRLGDGCTEIKARSTPFDGKIQTASRKERFYELVTATPLHGITSSTLDYIYTKLEDENLSKSSELNDNIKQAFSALEDELFEDKELMFENFPKLPLEVKIMIWEKALLKPKVVRIGIVPTERTVGNWEYNGGELMQIDKDVPMLLERNHFLKSPSCSLLSVNKESRAQALQVHGVFREQRRPCAEAEDGYVPINRIYVNWEIDTVWLDYNLSVAYRDNKMDPSDTEITPIPAYEDIRCLAAPAESIEWSSEYQVSDTGLAVADFPNLEDLILLVPTKETEWSNPILVPTAPNTTFFIYLEEFDMDHLVRVSSFLSAKMNTTLLWRISIWHAFDNFFSSDREEDIAAGHIRDLSTWNMPDVHYMKVSTIEEENVKVKAKALLEVLPAEVYEVDEEDTNGRRRGVNNLREGIIIAREWRLKDFLNR